MVILDTWELIFLMTSMRWYSTILWKKLNKLRLKCSLWLKRSLTVLGRITVVKSLLVSKLNYLFLALPNPTDETMKKIDRSFHNFIWEGKPD